MKRSETWLIAVAAPKEARAVLDGIDPVGGPQIPVPEVWSPAEIGLGSTSCELIRTGVGKAAAAGAIGRWFDPGRHAGVLSIGIAGALPGAGLDLGSAVLANPSIPTDEGVLTPGAFVSLSEMGFAEDAAGVHPDDRSRSALTPMIDVVGPIATVSVCSGTDAWSLATARRAGDAGSLGLAEAMEGFAAGMAARRIDPAARFAELRIISNTTGDRARQSWDLELALSRLGDVAGLAIRALNADTV